MGEVYRARDPRLNRDVAIKVLPAGFTADADRLRRFELEARAAGTLNHPNILAVHDFGSHEGAPYVVTELLEGETLRSRLATGAIVPRRAIEYSIQIAQGLAAAHEKGIVHRDLKPENLFVTEDGRVKILDFGLAKLVQPEVASGDQSAAPTATLGTEPGVVMGTAGYMSPEQVRGMAADHRSDIFSFGSILYEMLSGRRAFRGDSAVETMSAILKEDPPELSETARHLSPGLERLVRHCLEKSPAQRFQSARDLAYDLEALSGVSGPTVAARALSATRLQRFVWALIATAALVAAAAGGFLGASRLRPSKPPTYRQLTFRRGFVGTTRFAPDGHTVLYTASWNGEHPRLFSVRPESPESSALNLPEALLGSVSRLGELAIGVDAGEPSANPDFSTLARVPLSGGSPRDILKDVEAADWSPDGKELAVVHRVAGKARLEFPMGKVLYESTGEIYNLRVSPSGDRVAFADHPVYGDTDGSVIVVDGSGHGTPLSSGWYDVGSVAWSADGREVWFSASRTGNRRSLWAVTLSGRQRLLADVPGAIDMEDISPDGKVLLTHSTFRSSVLGVRAGETVERDLTWLDFSAPVDLSEDQKTLIFEEWGEGGGSSGSVYLRRLDRQEPVRLGEGLGLALSPDEQWVLTRLYTSPPRLVLLPTGAGEAKAVPGEGIHYGEAGAFLAGGKQILFLGHEAGRPSRIYRQDVEGGKPSPVTGEVETNIGNSGGIAVSPDGKLVAWPGADRRLMLYPLDGGEPRPVAGAELGEVPVRWSRDGRSLFVYRVDWLTVKVTRVDPVTGTREPLRELTPADPAGVQLWNYSLVLAADGKSYFWGVQRRLGEVYLVDGLK